MRSVAVCFWVLSLLGCVTHQVYDNPVGVVLNREAETSRRLDAARQAAQRNPRDPELLKACNTLVWDRGYPFVLRKFAIDHLISVDAAGFRKDLARRIVLIESWDTLDYLFKLAVEQNWRDFTPTVVRNYARKAYGMSDAQRPERQVLEKLNPSRSVEDVVFEVFANARGDMSPNEQTAAWELLARLVGTEKLIVMLAQAPDTTPLVIDLKASARDLHTLPRNKEGVLWLAYLRDPARQNFWAAAKARVARLTAEQKTGLELRHLPALLLLDDTTLAYNRAQMLATVSAAVLPAEHHLISPTYDGQAKDHPQALQDWADKLTWPDLAVIEVLCQSLREPKMVAELFAQADADHEDESTEYGGVLVYLAGSAAQSGRFAAILHKPMIRGNDRKFIPPHEMIQQLYTGLAHYHFHAQSFHNEEYAGPGRGDLDFADHMRCNCLVFTFIDRDRLNVDYYQSGRVVVDLCTIRR